MTSLELTTYRKQIKKAWFGVSRSGLVDELMWEIIYELKEEITRKMLQKVDKLIKNMFDIELDDIQTKLDKKKKEIEEWQNESS